MGQKVNAHVISLNVKFLFIGFGHFALLPEKYESDGFFANNVLPNSWIFANLRDKK